MSKRIAIGCDHGGYELKEFIKYKLEKTGYEVTDFGCHSTDSVDYPDIAHELCDSIKNDEQELGVLICGSGNGINMSANTHFHVRSALCWQPEIASLARQHNDANVMALPGRFIDEETAWQCVENFITEEFEGGRHQRRIDKIKQH
jgi:ribose 5-phosphate isomerase B